MTNYTQKDTYYTQNDTKKKMYVIIIRHLLGGNMKKVHIIKVLLQYIIVFAVTLAILIGVLIGTTAIPNDAIYDNMLESAEMYKNVKAYEFDESEQLRKITDNYADNILLNVLWNMKSDTPVESAFDTRYYDGDEYGLNWGLYSTVKYGDEADTDYTRYWHGMVVFIRPLLIWFNIAQIKWIGLGAAVVLLVLNLILLLKKKQYFAAVALLLSYVGVHFWLIVKSAEYQPAIIISLLMSLLFVALEKKGERCLISLAVISGVLIGFFDFLTTETMTILIPLALVLLVRQAEGRLKTWKDELPYLIKSVLAWGISYGMTFVMKWTLASLVLGENKFISSISSATVRIGGTEGEENLPLLMQIPSAVLANISTLFGGMARVDWHSIVVGLLVTVLIIGSTFYLFRGNYHKDISVLMLMLGVVPYVRYLVLNNHSYLHEFFTYRAQATTIMALLALVWYNTDRGLLKGRKKTAKKKKKGDGYG